MLDLSQFAFLVHVLDEQKFATVDDGFRHHVFQAGLFDLVANLLALFDGCCHRHGAHHVLAGIECFQRHPSMISDGAVDVHALDFRISQHGVEVGEASVDAKLVTRLVQFCLVASANRHDVSVRVSLIDRNELRPEAQADHCHLHFAITHRKVFPLPSNLSRDLISTVSIKRPTSDSM